MIHSQTKTSIKGQDRVEKLMKALSDYPHANVSIGIHEDAGEYGNGQSIVNVALFNEYGTEHIPSRSFFRTTLDEHESDLNEFRESLIEQIIMDKMTVEKALQALGFRIQTLIQNKIKSNVGPEYGSGNKPNDADTMARLQEQKRKQGYAPVTLIASGTMLRSITYKVNLK